MQLSRQDSGLQKFICTVKIEKVGPDSEPNFLISTFPYRLMNQAKLVAKLTIGTRRIENSIGGFPEAPSNRKNWVVLRKESKVILPVADVGSTQVP